MTHAHYTRVTSALIAGLLGAVVAFNYVVDPYDTNGRFRIDGLNAIKADLDGHLQESKPFVAHRVRPEALILGNSRPEHALDPKHPGWGSRRVYNLALPGASIWDLQALLDAAVTNSKLDTIVVSLDFMAYNVFAYQGVNATLSEALDARAWARVLFLARRAASWDLLESALRTVRRQQPEHAWFDADGRRNERTFEVFLARQGSYANAFHTKAREQLTVGYLTPPARRFAIADAARGDSMSAFAALLERARERGLRTRLYIAPSHARDLLVLRQLGLWAEFERWKRRLVEVHDRYARTFDTGLVDFSGANCVTAEDIPAPDSGLAMRWYWEASHYRRSTGDLVLTRLLQTRADLGVGCAFGRDLSGATVEAALAEVRAEMDHYVLTHPADLAEIERLGAAP